MWGGGEAFILMRMNANGCKMFVFLGCCCTLNKHKFRRGRGCTNWMGLDFVLFLGQCWCRVMPGELSASNSAMMSLFTFMSPPTNIPTTASVWSAYLLFLKKCEATPRREKNTKFTWKEMMKSQQYTEMSSIASRLSEGNTYFMFLYFAVFLLSCGWASCWDIILMLV